MSSNFYSNVETDGPREWFPGFLSDFGAGVRRPGRAFRQGPGPYLRGRQFRLSRGLGASVRPVGGFRLPAR